MLQLNKSSLFAMDTVARTPAQLLALVVSFLRRRLLILLLVFSGAMILGMAYLFTAPSKFTAKALMIIDTRKVQVFQQQSVLGDVGIDSAAIDTQMELLKSENVATSVIKELHLTDEPEFVGGSSGLLGSVIAWLSPPQRRSEFELTRQAVGVFSRGLSVKRVLSTYVIEISYQSLNPDLAAKIANATADAYIVDQLDAKYQATRRAGSWMQDRIQELRQQSSTAERAVLDFKAKNNIIDTGGRLIDDQQLTEQNSQLVNARASTAEAKARLDRITEITQNSVTNIDDVLRKPDAAVADALHNEIITKLRGQYLDLANREADFSVRLGKYHQAAINLRNQMGEIRKSIFAELQRIAETFKSDYEIAQARETSIRESLAGTVTQTQTTNQAQVNLRELESNAQTYRALHDNFLQRYMESVQQQSFPITEARLITPATHGGKSQPVPALVLAISATGGIFFAFAAALLIELSDRGFRTAGQVESILRTDCVAIVPLLKGPPGAAAPAGAELAPVSGRQLARSGRLAVVVDDPFSRFTEAIRSIKVAVDLASLDTPIRVLGITSALPNEGKSTIAANFASLVCHAGKRAILVDCDLRNPSLSRAMAPQAEVGVLEIISGAAQLEDAIWTDRRSGLSFVPLVARSRLTHTNEALASEGMRSLIKRLREQYDYVIVDLPPLAPVVDVRSTTQIIDSYVFVVEWGRTSPDMVTQILGSTPQICDKMLGVVLNKADLDVMRSYERYSGGGYYKQYYERYGLS